MLKVYTYAKCSTCQKAVKYLQGRDIKFQEIPIRETPPNLAELKQALGSKEGKIRSLFNTSGHDYREQELSAKLPGMTEKEALKLLTENGNLVKRPFVIAQGISLVGFDEPEWQQVLR